jgi:hypothetical protein
MVDQGADGRRQAAAGREHEMDDAVPAPPVSEDANELSGADVRRTGVIWQEGDA